MAWPPGPLYFATVSAIASRFGRPKTPWTAAFPKVCVPRRAALQLPRSAADSTSLALAVRSSTRSTSGARDDGTSASPVLTRRGWSPEEGVCTRVAMEFGSRNRAAVSMAAWNEPPGLPRRSSTSSSAPWACALCRAALMSSALRAPKFLSRRYPTLWPSPAGTTPTSTLLLAAAAVEVLARGSVSSHDLGSGPGLSKDMRTSPRSACDTRSMEVNRDSPFSELPSIEVTTSPCLMPALAATEPLKGGLLMMTSLFSSRVSTTPTPSGS
mmetsp:Transcript_49852/g.134076  ORF Transcript_49852/g.134076 Transcript_49852/m.134076 type:complete len:269 (-) Transcript_49852:281-1087(-)